MSSLRNLWVDLVDKRLWPVAAALVVALVAIPLLLAKPAPQAPPARPAVEAVPAPAPPAGGTAIADVSGTAFLGPVKGPGKDPFAPLRAPATASGSVAGASTAASSVASVATAVGGSGASAATTTGSSPSAGGSTGSGSSSGTTGPKPPGAATPVAGVSPAAVASIQFGLLGGTPTRRRIVELAALPSPTSPAIVYLGQTKQGQAAFLISSDVTARGQGRCAPSAKLCSTLYLTAGQVEYLNVATTAGQVVRYRLSFLGRITS